MPRTAVSPGAILDKTARKRAAASFATSVDNCRLLLFRFAFPRRLREDDFSGNASLTGALTSAPASERRRREQPVSPGENQAQSDGHGSRRMRGCADEGAHALRGPPLRGVSGALEMNRLLQRVPPQSSASL